MTKNVRSYSMASHENGRNPRKIHAGAKRKGSARRPLQASRPFFLLPWESSWRLYPEYSCRFIPHKQGSCTKNRICTHSIQTEHTFKSTAARAGPRQEKLRFLLSGGGLEPFAPMPGDCLLPESKSSYCTRSPEEFQGNQHPKASKIWI